MKRLLLGFALLVSCNAFASEICISDTSLFTSCNTYTGEGLFGAIDGTQVICKKEVDFSTIDGEQGRVMVLNASRKLEDSMTSLEAFKLRNEAKDEVKEQLKEIKAKYKKCN